MPTQLLLLLLLLQMLAGWWWACVCWLLSSCWSLFAAMLHTAPLPVCSNLLLTVLLQGLLPGVLLCMLLLTGRGRLQPEEQEVHGTTRVDLQHLQRRCTHVRMA